MDTDLMDVLARIEKKIDNIISLIGSSEDVKEDAEDVPVTDDDKKEVVEEIKEEITAESTTEEPIAEN
jgi:hypothetical protein